MIEKLIQGIQNPNHEWFWKNDINPVSKYDKLRILHKPNDDMRKLHRHVIRYVRRLLHGTSATGGLPRNSTRKNVQRHAKNRYFYVTDIKNAFSSVQVGRLCEVLKACDKNIVESDEELRLFFNKYFFAGDGGLAIGLPASPDLFNLYAGYLIDNDLYAYSKKHEICYTRYIDDLTFSSDIPIGKRKRRVLREIITRAGFLVSHRKSFVVDSYVKPITICGVRLYKGRMFLPRSYLRFLKGFIYKAATGKEIKPEQVHGRMGVFWNATAPYINQTENRVVRLYQKFKKMQSI